MVSHSYYKPINGYFPTFSSLLGCTTPSDHSDRHSDRRAPQCVRDRQAETVNKSENITGPTRQRPSGVADSNKTAKTASSRHVRPFNFAASPAALPRGASGAASSRIRPVQASPTLHTPFRPTDGRRLMVYSHLTHRIDGRQTLSLKRTNLQSI